MKLQTQIQVRKTDAAEISADDPTVYLCDAGSEGRRKNEQVQRFRF